MERRTRLVMEDILKIKEMFGKYFLGFDKIKDIFSTIQNINIPYDIDFLKKYKDTHILILGSEINIIDIIKKFGMNDRQEPCFYNQDWYMNEKFINKKLENRWYLIRRELLEDSRGKFPTNDDLHSAVLLVYTFFINYIVNNEILWKYDYIWCSDFDHNDDQIYVGRYLDPNKMNKNGFNIHRHLKIKNNIGTL